MTVQPVAQNARPRVAPQRPRTTPAGRVAAPRSTASPSSATILVEVAVSGLKALETATRLAGEIRDLVDSTGAESPSTEVAAAVGLQIGAGNSAPRTGRPALSSVTTLPSQPGRATWTPGARPTPVPAPTSVAGAPLQIYPARRVTLLDGEQLLLTRREFDLLLFLAEHAGRVFDRPQLLRLVWGHQVVCGERTVDVHVRRLRAKVEGTGPVISTVRGVGYRLDAAERIAVVHDGA